MLHLALRQTMYADNKLVQVTCVTWRCCALFHQSALRQVRDVPQSPRQLCMKGGICGTSLSLLHYLEPVLSFRMSVTCG